MRPKGEVGEHDAILEHALFVTSAVTGTYRRSFQYLSGDLCSFILNYGWLYVGPCEIWNWTNSSVRTIRIAWN